MPGQTVFDALAEAEPGTFYLTDFLARQFDTLVIEGLGLDRHPELLPDYFGNYRRLVYLAQTEDPELQAAARSAADAARARLRVPLHRARRARRVRPHRLRALSMAEKVVVYWRDIPAQVIVKAGRKTAKRAAARAVRAGDRPRRDAGPAHRHRRLSRAVAARRPACPAATISRPRPAAAAEALEAEFTAERLRELVANGGNATA